MKQMQNSWDKRSNFDEALGLIAESGISIAFGGVTLYRRPMAFALAMLQHYSRSRTFNNVTLVCITAGLECDILIESGMVEAIRTCYAGLEVFGLAPHFTASISAGTLKMIEETEGSFAYGLRAALAGVGFMPSPAWQGTDLLDLRRDVKSIRDPYTGDTLTAFPALKPDVAVIHALAADHEGNAIIGKNMGVDQELALVADKVIITAETIVPSLERADIIAPVVDAVIPAPHGAWPTSCHPEYALDGQAILDYTDQCHTDGYASLISSWSERHEL